MNGNMVDVEGSQASGSQLHVEGMSHKYCKCEKQGTSMLYIILRPFPHFLGNMVVDSLMERYFNLPYDNDGKIVSVMM